MYVDPRQGRLSGIQVLLAAVSACPRRLNGCDHSARVLRIQVGTPKLRRGWVLSGWMCAVHAGQRHTARGGLDAVCTAIGSPPKPAEEGPQSDETSCGDAEASLNVRPD